HGFFKANMFLGAGSVMHGMNDDVNMRHYGALAGPMKLTFLTFGLGYLAIIGFPFFAGFYSKDHIIEAAFQQNTVYGVLALIGAGVTAYYMTRLMMMTFFGKKRWEDGVEPHESPFVMTFPLIVLAILSVGAGLLMNGWIQDWLAPTTGQEPHNTPLIHFTTVGLITLAVVAVGVAIGWFLHKGDIPREAPATKNPLVHAGRNDLYGDAFNEHVVIRPAKGLAAGLGAFDRSVADGAVMGSAAVASGVGEWFRKLQNGYVRSYGLTAGVGLLLLAAVVIIGQLG
ncbi:MAG: proton-conducting transporter membrane subunit, partial [Propionibacteriaceae bacterium]|nr:proton-conducting transporter membrane subunit [Propionibacteriaceae bacterium]